MQSLSSQAISFKKSYHMHVLCESIVLRLRTLQFFCEIPLIFLIFNFFFNGTNRSVSYVATLNPSKKQGKICETVSYSIVLKKLCTFGNPTFTQKMFLSFLVRVMLQIQPSKPCQKRSKTFTIFTLKFQTLKCLPNFLMLSSNLQGIKLKSVKMPR